MNAVVIKSTGSWYRVLLENGESVMARARGKMRISMSRNTNHITVGDRVDVAQDGEDFIIEKVQQRSNYIIRKSTNLSKETHVIAANIDLAILVCTLKEPKIKFGFIDRFLLTAQAYGIEAVIVFNKTDLLNDREMEYLSELRDAYSKVGYASLVISVVKNEGIEHIRKLINGKISLFSGTSGVGKSSLLNALNPSIEAKVSEISDFNEKGKHTTTFAEMHAISAHTFIIDTPGLKSFGLIDMEPEELKNYFPEMVKLSDNCRFHNCLHLNEPGCAVKPEYEEGRLPWFRYENYLHFFDELKTLNA